MVWFSVILVAIAIILFLVHAFEVRRGTVVHAWYLSLGLALWASAWACDIIFSTAARWFIH